MRFCVSKRVYQQLQARKEALALLGEGGAVRARWRELWRKGSSRNEVDATGEKTTAG